MTDPLDFDGLVEMAAAHAWFKYCDSLGWPNGQPTWQELVEFREDGPLVAHRELIRAQARASLRAVLPHVLAGPREGLRPFAQVSSFFPERYYQPPDAVAELVRRREYARIEVGHIRRAVAELARIDKLTEGL